MAQGRSTNIISMIEWIRTSRLSLKNCLSLTDTPQGAGEPRPLTRIADYSLVDILGVRYNPVNFGAVQGHLASLIRERETQAKEKAQLSAQLLEVMSLTHQWTSYII